MKRIVHGSLVLILALLSTQCSKEKTQLQTLNWDSFNRSQIEQLINRYGKHSAGYNPEKPPYAVFDWDNTSIFLDIEEAVLAYQIQQLAFKATPEQLNEAIRKDIDNTDFAVAYNNKAGAAVNIEKIAPDIIESYTWLYRNYKGLAGNQTLENVKKNVHYAAFTSKLRYLYEAIGGTFSHTVSYPWVTYLFTGMIEAEVRALTQQTIEWQLSQAIGTETWETPENLSGTAGCVSVSWKNGLRIPPEMQDLYQTFRQNGFDVWVCSASFIDVIREFSSNPAYGYANPFNQALAMELERDANGKIQVRFREGYDQTQGKGKTKTINRFLVSKYGYGPVFIAGDSEGDQNMMQDFEDTKLVLIINRWRSPDTLIGQFSKQAVDTYKNPDAKYLLQGRDDNTGLFVPSQASYPLGTDVPKVLK
ncbi:phosphoserine phosphatase [Bacteroidia bacterium]|nr:phosphoserine phosphatase [Bacteroidia bacterium]